MLLVKSCLKVEDGVDAGHQTISENERKLKPNVRGTSIGTVML